jgi:hypothetical protein
MMTGLAEAYPGRKAEYRRVHTGERGLRLRRHPGKRAPIPKSGRVSGSSQIEDRYAIQECPALPTISQTRAWRHAPLPCSARVRFDARLRRAGRPPVLSPARAQNWRRHLLADDWAIPEMQFRGEIKLGHGDSKCALRRARRQRGARAAVPQLSTLPSDCTLSWSGTACRSASEGAACPKRLVVQQSADHADRSSSASGCTNASHLQLGLPDPRVTQDE